MYSKQLKPMLIGMEQPPFDDPDFIYEVKFDGIRVLAYCEDQNVIFQNKRLLKLTDKFPEFKDIYKQIKKPCILDGELYVYKNGITDFFEIQKRALTQDTLKHRLASKKAPATFTAFDVLYVEDENVMQKPLIQRKKILAKLIKENDRVNISRYIEEQGTALFAQTANLHLEGIVAKQKNSLYYPDKRTKEWIKCKHMLDDDFVICGYIPKDHHMVSLVLGQYRNKELIYKGHVTMGVSLPYLFTHCKAIHSHEFEQIRGNENAIWITPMLVGTVKFMMYTEHGGMRQPVFKGFREDKLPTDCKDTWYGMKKEPKE